MPEHENENISAAELQECLKGTDYPADRNELITVAEGNDAPKNVMNFLERIPNKKYETPIDVSKELSEQVSEEDDQDMAA